MPFAIAYAPATVANLGVGFDVLGLALKSPGDIVRAELRDTPGVVIASIEGDGGKLPLEPTQNTAGTAAASVLRLLGTSKGVTLHIKKQLPLGSGLGSSAASAVAAAMAVNALFGEPLPREELLAPSLDGEAVASGYHPDNVGPSLFGGITLFTAPSADEMSRLPVPLHLNLALVTPNVMVKTADARAVLPQDVPLKSMIRQTGLIARLVDALYRGDVPLMGRLMEQDCVIEPARQHLMPHFGAVRVAAKAAGALGLVISGAGPTLLAVCDHAATAAQVAEAMHGVYAAAGIEAKSQHGQVSREGAQVLEAQPYL